MIANKEIKRNILTWYNIFWFQLHWELSEIKSANPVDSGDYTLLVYYSGAKNEQNE